MVAVRRTVRDPEWLAEDMQAALQWAAYKATICRCGRSRLESMDPANVNAYEVTEMRCFACQAIGDRAHARAQGRHKDAPPDHGLYSGVRLDYEDDDDGSG